ncbi:MAG: hypothetical protein CVT74_15305 [Alphaproteobacteria bacterium HGW-Alphaproteobacteria-13]|nr:MAG: hypothetical protein CVT74_15305 [Alphaproteobacteria bacterium HGW-Alphaproteobacteria-13]
MVNRRQPIEFSEQDRAVLNRLGRKFRRPLLTYFGRRTSDFCDLEDMVQDVFERLIKRGNAAELERQNCQTAFKRDPRSASKRDPLFG